MVKALSSKEAKIKGAVPSTDGIDVSDWEFDEITFHCWDFAGQELFYSSHQYFLSSASIYVATFSLDNDISQNRLDYWIKTVTTLSPSSHIVVVGTHCDSKRCTDKYLEKVVILICIINKL